MKIPEIQARSVSFEVALIQARRVSAFLRGLTMHSLARFEVAQFKICNFRGAGKFETQREGVKDNSVFSVPVCFYFLRRSCRCTCLRACIEAGFHRAKGDYGWIQRKERLRMTLCVFALIFML